MSVTVKILGVALFETDGDDLERISFPDAFTEDPRDHKNDNKKKRHNDHSEANSHFPLLLVNGELPISLLDASVEVIPSTAGRYPWKFGKCGKSIACLRNVKTKALKRDSAAAATAIRMLGEAGSHPTPSGDVYGFKEKSTVKSVYAEVHFKYAAGITINVTYHQPYIVRTPIVVADGEVAFWHADLTKPMIPGKKPLKNQPDDDFKWIYSLLYPESDMDFDAWAKGGLPAPYYDPALQKPSSVKKPHTPTVSTCFPGWI